jgi:hypothetical protein
MEDNPTGMSVGLSSILFGAIFAGPVKAYSSQHRSLFPSVKKLARIGFLALPQPGRGIKAFFNLGAGCGNRARSSPLRAARNMPCHPQK